MLFECDECTAKCKFRSKFFAHFQLHASVQLKRYACPACSQTFKAVSARNAHFKTRHGNSDSTNRRCYQCGAHCEKKWNTRAELLAHESSVHLDERRVLCTDCGRRFNRIAALHSHRRAKHEEKRLMCDECDRLVGDLHGLVEHLRMHAEHLPYECHWCQKRFRYSFQLSIHKRRHANDLLRHQCHHCDKRFASTRELRWHEDRHLPYKRRDLQCQQCGKCYAQKIQLQSHAMAHLQKNILNCWQCDGRFRSKIGLQYHVRSHAVELPPPCRRCQERLCSWSAFKQHAKTRKRFCAQCRKCFTDSAITRHERWHVENAHRKLFECFTCGVKVVSASVMYRHSLTHSTIRRIACFICGLIYRGTLQLTKHMNGKHSRQ